MKEGYSTYDFRNSLRDEFIVLKLFKHVAKVETIGTRFRFITINYGSTWQTFNSLPCVIEVLKIIGRSDLLSEAEFIRNSGSY